jgi:hypothetical protein
LEWKLFCEHTLTHVYFEFLEDEGINQIEKIIPNIMSFWLFAFILLRGISVHSSSSSSSSEEVYPILAINSGAQEDFVDEDGNIWLVRKTTVVLSKMPVSMHIILLCLFDCAEISIYRRIDSTNQAMRTTRQSH